MVVQAQSIAQFASTMMTAHEKKMADICHTVSQLQQLVIDERKRRMDMEHKFSSVQDKIGAVERQTCDLTSKNRQLTSEVASWTATYNT